MWSRGIDIGQQYLYLFFVFIFIIKVMFIFYSFVFGMFPKIFDFVESMFSPNKFSATAKMFVLKSIPVVYLLIVVRALQVTVPVQTVSANSGRGGGYSVCFSSSIQPRTDTSKLFHCAVQGSLDASFLPDFKINLDRIG